jgi:cyclic di-GMP phosphodiesterase
MMRRTSAQTNQRILVVDDARENRTLLERLFTGHGYIVETAQDGESALECIARAAPDIVLLDVQMPGPDGFEVCRRLKNDPATRLIPIVLITGLSDGRSRLEGINAGADDFVNKPFDAEELLARIRSLVRLKQFTDDLDSAESVILSLALTVEARDATTSGHCQRLARYATMLGAALRLGNEEISALHRGGYLHDLGKIAISDAVLLKPHRLTESEYTEMKKHTVIGEKLCGPLRSLALVRPIVRHHHERLDGSGYPDQLRGSEVPLLAQIVGIVDAFDAITTNRPYRRAQPERFAFEQLRADAARGLCSRDLVETFIAALEAQPDDVAGRHHSA